MLATPSDPGYNTTIIWNQHNFDTSLKNAADDAPVFYLYKSQSGIYLPATGINDDTGFRNEKTDYIAIHASDEPVLVISKAQALKEGITDMITACNWVNKAEIEKQLVPTA